MTRNPIPLDVFVDYASTLLDLAEDAAFALSQDLTHIFVLDPTTMSMSKLDAQVVVDQWMELLYNTQSMLRTGRIIETGDESEPRTKMVVCPECNGQAWHTWTDVGYGPPDENGEPTPVPIPMEAPCERCDGLGEVEIDDAIS